MWYDVLVVEDTDDCCYAQDAVVVAVAVVGIHNTTDTIRIAVVVAVVVPRVDDGDNDATTSVGNPSRYRNCCDDGVH
jgi:hypothetical protein